MIGAMPAVKFFCKLVFAERTLGAYQNQNLSSTEPTSDLEVFKYDMIFHVLYTFSGVNGLTTLHTT